MLANFLFSSFDNLNALCCGFCSDIYFCNDAGTLLNFLLSKLLVFTGLKFMSC